MRINPYRTYLDALEGTEPNPPFSEIRHLVLHDRRVRRIPLFYRYAAGTILAGLLTGAAQHITERSVSFAKPTTAPVTNETCITRAAMKRGITPAIQQAIFSRKVALLEPSLVPAIAASNLSGTVPARFILSSNALPSPVAVKYDAPESQVSQWHALVAYSPAALTGSTFAFSQFAGAIGFGYSISKNSSLLMEVRQTEFQSSHSGQAGGLRDTILTVGGQTYRSTIGGNSSSSSNGTERITSLDLGYQYLLNPDNVISPNAELLLGASTSGVVASESLGILYRLSTSLSLDVFARDMQFYSSASVPLSAISAEAAMEFEW